ncbi:CAP domain-containing protein [Marinibacterium profundimaris]|uniref:CAP domain-containing protein n=1 Tax=Marinibacterium profundimaris TaxID=1679460 RepID=UPI0013031154|nr:CAP domain-containing protein [Marinibacterium profundimaris]
MEDKMEKQMWCNPLRVSGTGGQTALARNRIASWNTTAQTLRLPNGAALALLLGFLLLIGSQMARAEDRAALRDAALQHVNQSRTDEGLPPLEPGASLDEAAQKHAEDMLKRGYYSHTTPQGDGPRDRFLDAGGGEWERVAENIARCRNCGALDRERVATFHEGWMDSPGHRANILSEGLARFGFGAVALDGRIYAVQTFAGPGNSRGRDGTEIEAGGASDIAQEVLNAERTRAGVAPVNRSPALTEAAMEALPADLGGMRIESLDPFGTFPQELREFGRLQALVSECGGCGTVATAGDVRAFLGDWLEAHGRRVSLLDGETTHLGMALRSDWEGRKVALLLLGTR